MRCPGRGARCIAGLFVASLFRREPKRSTTMLMTGLSGNEIYCLAQKGYSPGNIVVGNSVHSLGWYLAK